MTVALKLQVRSVHGIRHLSWQGDTQALSLDGGRNGHPQYRGLDNHYAGSGSPRRRGKSLAFIGGG
ncbi:hypothetical protein KCP75_06345 [Salmonella enterica subsp. enterica]|nr:hypothetical protein KCP75_06345 [Salmonella enterica subsp. enterica]